MKVKVFKFGGASVKDAEGVRNVTSIIKEHNSSPLVVVISAMNKTTNALEKVVDNYFIDREKAVTELSQIKDDHLAIIDELWENKNSSEQVKADVLNHFVEADWILEEEAKDGKDYIYDQIVSVGELVSTTIVSAYLNLQEVNTKWVDARGLIRTDRQFQSARVDWEITARQIRGIEKDLVDAIVLTQGFIGSTSENESTTLGREGSDFTGAIISYCLDASELSIWKDVDGVLTADPREFDKTSLIEELSYNEAVEMTFYGAKVIHPKTIKPLQNKKIPLKVRSFENKDSKHTTIHAGSKDEIENTIIIKKDNQILLNFRTIDFSFIEEAEITKIMSAFAHHGINVNLIQNGAIKFFAVVDNEVDDIIKVEEELSDHFTMTSDSDLTLLTLRHYNDASIQEFTAGKDKLLVQQSSINYQVLYK